MSLMGVRREKVALSSGCKSHPATAPAGSNLDRRAERAERDQPDLDFIGWILRSDALASAIVRSGEDRSLNLEVEGHVLCTALHYLGLAFSVRG
jgi:hypothetical protein